MVHLCNSHQREWDEAGEATATARRRTVADLPKERRPYCINSDCRAGLNDSRFQLCARCAARDRICQQCSASTLTPEELVVKRAEEERQALLEDAADLFTLAVKAFGLASARALLMQETPWNQEILNRTLALGHRDLDYGRAMRPLWREVLGTDVYRLRWCASCSAPTRSDPALTKGDFCRHLTVGRVAAYCPLCAAEAHACERCGDPV